MAIPLLFVVSLPCLLFGLFLCCRPILAIEVQKKFYAKINWRMEPIDLPKEIRNTKIMGCSLVIFVLAVVLFQIFFRDWQIKPNNNRDYYEKLS